MHGGRIVHIPTRSDISADASPTYAGAIAGLPRRTGRITVKIVADADACIGAGQCALVAGEIFDQDDAGLVTVLDDDPDEVQLTLARRAASLCPARAIRILESS
jgi:ferredoxin